MRNKLLVAGTLALAMTCTTVFSSITPAVVKAASVSTAQTQTAENSDDYVYCYAGLTWAEYKSRISDSYIKMVCNKDCEDKILIC